MHMLAEGAAVSAGDRVIVMHGGPALPAVVAAHGAGPAGHVLVTDRHVLGAESASRTLAERAADPATGPALAPFDVRHWHGVPPDAAGQGSADVVLVRTPAERLPLAALLRDAWVALRPGGRCLVAGATNEGIKSAAGAMERLFGGVRVMANARGHRMLLSVRPDTGGGALPEEFADPRLDAERYATLPVRLRGHELAVSTRPGVFSWEHLDEATALLGEAMEVDAGARVLDLGCGAGVLGTLAGTLGAGAVTMVDVDAEALRCARRTAEAAGVHAETLASDVASAVRGREFDVVLTNPPFHVGRNTELTVPRQFIAESWDALARGGTLWLVANRTLPYERLIGERFGEVRVVHDGARFKVLAATRG